jgi:preprotein translocase subunit SecA
MRGVAHAGLSARHDYTEAEDIAEAGQSGSIVIAANIAGRHADIELALKLAAAGDQHGELLNFTTVPARPVIIR